MLQSQIIMSAMLQAAIIARLLQNIWRQCYATVCLPLDISLPVTDLLCIAIACAFLRLFLVCVAALLQSRRATRSMLQSQTTMLAILHADGIAIAGAFLLLFLVHVAAMLQSKRATASMLQSQTTMFAMLQADGFAIACAFLLLFLVHVAIMLQSRLIQAAGHLQQYRASTIQPWKGMWCADATADDDLGTRVQSERELPRPPEPVAPICDWCGRRGRLRQCGVCVRHICDGCNTRCNVCNTNTCPNCVCGCTSEGDRRVKMQQALLQS